MKKNLSKVLTSVCHIRGGGVPPGQPHRISLNSGIFLYTNYEKEKERKSNLTKGEDLNVGLRISIDLFDQIGTASLIGNKLCDVDNVRANKSGTVPDRVHPLGVVGGAKGWWIVRKETKEKKKKKKMYLGHHHKR